MNTENTTGSANGPAASGPTPSGEEQVKAAAEAAASASAETPETNAPKNHLDDLIGELRRDLADYKDRNLRLMADMENLRRRTEDEKASAQKYAVTKFAGDVVALADNFQRAASAVPQGATETNPALKSLLDGVNMIEREFLNVLERHGVKRIPALGEIFSPHFHQPMMQIPNAGVPAGTILAVLQEGYMIGDRVLRASIVSVSEGGPKPGKPSDTTASESSPAQEPLNDGSKGTA